APSTTALPLLAVLVAVTVASFGGSVLAGVAHGRDHAATAAVGADARLENLDSLPAWAGRRARRLPGGREVSPGRGEDGRGPVRVENDLSLDQGTAQDTFALLVVDPASYARLAAHTGLDGGRPFPARPLARDDGHRPLAAVVSPGLARAFAGGTGQVPAAAGP